MHDVQIGGHNDLYILFYLKYLCFYMYNICFHCKLYCQHIYAIHNLDSLPTLKPSKGLGTI